MGRVAPHVEYLKGTPDSRRDSPSLLRAIELLLRAEGRVAGCLGALVVGDASLGTVTSSSHGCVGDAPSSH